MRRIVIIFLIISITSAKGLNSAALESKLINGDKLWIGQTIFLTTLRHKKDTQWIRFCSLHCISATFFLTVERCIDKMEKHGGKDNVLIFLGNPAGLIFDTLQIKDYQDHADYLRRRRKPQYQNMKITRYDIILVWGESFKLGLRLNGILPTSDKYISSLAESKVLGWTDEGLKGKKSRESQITVEDLDFEKCSGLFKDEKINNHTHICGHAINNTQNAEIDDYGSPLLNKNGEVIGIVSHVPILSLRSILFVRIHEMPAIIESWKSHVKKLFHYEASKRCKPS